MSHTRFILPIAALSLSFAVSALAGDPGVHVIAAPGEPAPDTLCCDSTGTCTAATSRCAGELLWCVDAVSLPDGTVECNDGTEHDMVCCDGAAIEGCAPATPAAGCASTILWCDETAQDRDGSYACAGVEGGWCCDTSDNCVQTDLTCGSNTISVWCNEGESPVMGADNVWSCQ